MKIEEARKIYKQALARTHSDLIKSIFDGIYRKIENASITGESYCFVEIFPVDKIFEVSERLVKEGYTIEKYANGVKVIWT